MTKCLTMSVVGVWAVQGLKSLGSTALTKPTWVSLVCRYDQITFETSRMITF